MTPQARTITELLAAAGAQRFLEAPLTEDLGLSEGLPFPFLALVGQSEMKLALLLSLINPNVDGVLLIGNRGTGKSTAVRSLIDLLPDVDRSLCPYGCLPEDIETGGIDEVCPDCARKYGEGESLIYQDPVQLIELPLNSRLEDVIGGLNSRSGGHHRHQLTRGILARADRNLLYIDEVNMLDDQIVDAILDAAAQGAYTVRRGTLAATYRSRFVLIGSMNPEEGRLRPQILDRFGLLSILPIGGIGPTLSSAGRILRARRSCWIGNLGSRLRMACVKRWKTSGGASEARGSKRNCPFLQVFGCRHDWGGG